MPTQAPKIFTVFPSLSPTSFPSQSPTASIDIVKIAQSPPGLAISILVLFLFGMSIWMCFALRRRRRRYRQVLAEQAFETEMMRFNFTPDDQRRLDII